jgi:plastocyanin
MRFTGMAVLVSALVLGACGGGDKNAQGGAASDTGAAAATTTPPGGTPAAGTTGGTAAAGAMAPITGTTHEVKMLGDEKGYRFDPVTITVKQGDGIKWVMVSGGPHNVAFDPATLPAGAKEKLSANMPNQQGELSSPMFMNPNESYTVSFAGVPKGDYPYHCTPHLALGMKGTVKVQ